LNLKSKLENKILVTDQQQGSDGIFLKQKDNIKKTKAAMKTKWLFAKCFTSIWGALYTSTLHV